MDKGVNNKGHLLLYIAFILARARLSLLHKLPPQLLSFPRGVRSTPFIPHTHTFRMMISARIMDHVFLSVLMLGAFLAPNCGSSVAVAVQGFMLLCILYPEVVFVSAAIGWDMILGTVVYSILTYITIMLTMMLLPGLLLAGCMKCILLSIDQCGD